MIEQGTTWKNKKIEQGFNHAHSTVNEMTDFFETRLENLEPKEDKKNFQQPLRKEKIRNLSRKCKEKTPTQEF